MFQLDLGKFFSAPGLAWQAALKKTDVKLELSTDINMLLMVDKGSRGGISPSFKRYAKANKKYITGYNKNKEWWYLKYCDANILYGWAISQRLPVNGFECAECISEFDEGFMKSYKEEGDEVYFLKVDSQYTEELYKTKNDLLIFMMKLHIFFI